MERLSKEERRLLFRLVNNGIEQTLTELDDDYLERDVLTKYELVQCFVGLENKGLIIGEASGSDNWYVDMWGMLNLSKLVLTQSGKDYFIREAQLSCIDYYAPGKEERVELPVSDSLRELQDLVAEKAGEDESDLIDLILELQEMIDNLEQTKQIVKNSGFVRRLGKQKEKHGWFYTDVMSLLGQTVVRIAGGMN